MIKFEDTGERIEGNPRSLIELAFVAGMRECRHCRAHSDVSWSSWRVQDGLYRSDGECGGCGKERAYLFRSELDLADIEPPLYELGGPEPSTVMNATDLVREIERIGPLVVAPTQVAEAERSTAWTRLERALTAVNELAKFLDADTIPTLSDDLRARYDRQSIERERVRLVGLEDMK
ncbi:MAG: hypothetical protein M4D80_13475 [Myxococcota bacterium]|nr:hypothetical protein [Deltaproteobacteria bacterium]MDQ3336174.1 hypothetical protein [Myxococcota bacterium]